VADVSRAAFVASLLASKDTPFHHQGRVIGEGLDCPGPGVLACRAHGIDIPDVAGYTIEPNGSLRPYLDQVLIRVERSALQLGDVVLNAFKTKTPRHIAYIVGQAYGEWEMLHACAVRGKVIVERIQYDRYYRYVQGYRVPGVEP
jgi:cell wall-associated NlpC family hydrolase